MKPGDWIEVTSGTLKGERLLLVSIREFGRSVLGVDSSGLTAVATIESVTHLPDCDGWDWVKPELLQLREGAYYKTRGGRIVGPLKALENETYCWCVESGGTFTKDGRCWDSATISVDDLIREVPAPAPNYRPFADADEFSAYRDCWVRWKEDNGTETEFARHSIHSYSDKVVWIGGGSSGLHYSVAFNRIQFEDGTPFGVRTS